MKTTRLLVALLLVSLLGACGGDNGSDDDAGGATTAPASGTTGTGEDNGEAGGTTTEAGGAGQEHEHADFPAAEATQVVKIGLRDYAFVDMPATVTGPRVRIEGDNDGPSAHEMVVFDADGNEVGGVEPFVSGETKALSLELTAGTYEMRCQIAIDSNETHADRGMRVTFAVM